MRINRYNLAQPWCLPQRHTERQERHTKTIGSVDSVGLHYSGHYSKGASLKVPLRAQALAHKEANCRLLRRTPRVAAPVRPLNRLLRHPNGNQCSRGTASESRLVCNWAHHRHRSTGALSLAVADMDQCYTLSVWGIPRTRRSILRAS